MQNAFLRTSKNVQNALVGSTDRANVLINMYGKFGRLVDAQNVFEGMQSRTAAAWSSLLLGYMKHGESTKALDLFSRMECEGFQLSPRIFLVALKACGDIALKSRVKLSSRERAKVLHLLASSFGFDWDVYVGNTLVDLYAKCGCMENACKVFEGMRNRTSVSWNALILGSADNGKSEEALCLLWRMESEGITPTSRCFVAAFKACTDIAMKEKLPSVSRGKALHLLALSSGCDSNMFLESALVDLCAKCGCMEDARNVFDNMQSKDSVTWNTLMFGYITNGQAETTLQVFSRMRYESCVPCSRSFLATFKACSELSVSKETRGKALHLLSSSLGRDLDLYVGNTLVDFYSNCRNMVDAQKVFDQLQYPDVVSWNALLLGYAENGDGEAALDLFVCMKDQSCVPDAATFIAVSKGCSALASREQEDCRLVKVVCRERGKAVHLLAYMKGWVSDVCVECAFVDMYAKCGSMEDARRVFNMMKFHDIVSWNTLIFGYTKNEEAHLVLELYTRMKGGDCEPDACTLLAALKACGKLGALETGKTIHTEISSRRLEKDVTILNSLVDFYAKCGSLTEAKASFDSHPCKDLISWSSLMAGYSRHGDTQAVLDLFEMMQSTTNLKPDCITFSCILAACSHAGLVEKGKHYFKLMSINYGIQPDEDHYTSMVDILGRANKLDEAMVFLRGMPITANAVTWMSVLGSCRKWKNVDLGRLSFQSLMSLDDQNVIAYALMGSLYGSKGMWEDQAVLKASRDKLKVVKKPGQSWWTDRWGMVHRFMVSDKSHPQSQQIYEKLKSVYARMKEHGYVADTSSITRDISDEEKEDALCGHSERLAIACALINTSPGETIRVIKNLRVCDDCHAATVLISTLERRIIICRDATRFHVFKDGVCSCGDFW